MYIEAILYKSFENSNSTFKNLTSFKKKLTGAACVVKIPQNRRGTKYGGVK